MSDLLNAVLLSGLVSLAIVAGVPIEKTIPVKHGFDCVAFVKPAQGAGMFYLCSETALSLAWREI